MYVHNIMYRSIGPLSTIFNVIRSEGITLINDIVCYLINIIIITIFRIMMVDIWFISEVKYSLQIIK